VRFWNAVGPHGAPFVVIVAEPEFGDVFPAMIVSHFIGWKMRVIVDDGLTRCGGVKEIARCVAQQEEIGIKIGSSHGQTLTEKPHMKSPVLFGLRTAESDVIRRCQ